MAKFAADLSPELQRFIQKQAIFFTATAPNTGRINLSPKGMDTFRCFDAQTVAYLDLTGSGNETAAHLRENGRMTIMFCSFAKKPLILRLYGQGEVVSPRQEATWAQFAPAFDLLPGTRQIIVLHIESVQTSCGYGVPLFSTPEVRPTLVDWAEKKGDHGVTAYWQKNNQTSIDGLPTGIFPASGVAQTGTTSE